MARLKEGQPISQPRHGDSGPMTERGGLPPPENGESPVRFNWGPRVKPVYGFDSVNREDGHIPVRLVGPEAENIRKELKLSSEPVVLYRREGPPLNPPVEEHIGLST